ncbi:MAG TPA: MauE/DoxX family redox-associated membrane protein [Steroidobacteraceae bacterium]|nr:MauE/DoxX family redox-associated membrane protein [Steroidobacteraceae bacterium]
MLDPAIGLTLVGCFALLFASAALHKLRNVAHFREALRAYRLLPEGASFAAAAALPALELALAVGLLSAMTRAAAALAGLALLLGYAAAIAVNLARGRRDLACGCGGAQDSRPIAPWMVVRNLLLAVLLTVALVPFSSRTLLPTDALTVAAGIAVAALLYASLDRLLGSAARRAAALRTTP